MSDEEKKEILNEESNEEQKIENQEIQSDKNDENSNENDFQIKNEDENSSKNEFDSKNKKKSKKSGKKDSKKIEKKYVLEKIKSFNVNDIRVNFSLLSKKIQENSGLVIGTVIATFVIMVLFCVAVFFMNVQGPEQVLVPNVMGKSLEDALLEMQEKELYPKINLRYSETPGDEGTILDQSPEAGAIVKGYSRVTLVVSRGVVINQVENYVGQKLDDVQMRLQTLFAGSTKPLIVLSNPQYKPDLSEAGTILEQNPPEGTEISEPIQLELVVSRGPNYENTRVPNLIGQSVNDLLQTIARSKLVFDITTRPANEGEQTGYVISQTEFETEFVPNYTRIAIEMTLPERSSDGNVTGIFTQTLPEYPYPVAMRLEAVPFEGEQFTIVSFNHPGGNLTIPYSVPSGSTLKLIIGDRENSRITVN